MIKTALKWFRRVVIALLVIVDLLSVYSLMHQKINHGQPPSIAGFRGMSVLTGSMRPVFQPGDTVITRGISPVNIKVGDIITFKKKSGMLITHRVVGIINADGNLFFKTKGDDTNIEDSSLVSPGQLLGLVVFRIPFGGYFSHFARSPAGFTLLVIIPIILLAVGWIKFCYQKR